MKRARDKIVSDSSPSSPVFSGDSDDNIDPHPNMTFVSTVDATKTYIYFAYIPSGSTDPETRAALLDTASLSKKKIKDLLTLLKGNEQLTSYVIDWVNEEQGITNVLALERYRGNGLENLEGAWSMVPFSTDYEENGATLKISAFFCVEGAY